MSSTTARRHVRGISLRQRFQVLAAAAGIVLLGVAFYAQQAATRLSLHNEGLARVQRELGAAVERVSVDLHKIGVGVYQTSFLGADRPSQSLKDDILALRHHVSELARLSTELDPEELSDPVADLAIVTNRMISGIEELFELQSDVERRYPAMPIMLNKLAPTNNDFISALSVAIEDAKSVTRRPKQAEILSLLQSLKYDWSQLVSASRVFVANRLGAFGPPISGMDATVTDRQIFSSEIARLLNALSVHERNGHLTMVESDSVQRMSVLFDKYEHYFVEAAKIFYSDDWQADRALLRHDIDPMLAISWSKVTGMQKQLNLLSQTGFSDSAATTQSIGKFIWMLTGITFLLLIAGYVAFEYMIRRPIVQVAKALEAEGRGDNYLPTLQHAAPETEMLVTAFAEMRDQVRSRQSRLQAILDNAGEGIFTFNSDGLIETFNSSAEKLFGMQSGDVTGQPIALLLPENATLIRSNKFLSLALQKDVDVFGIEHEILGRRASGEEFFMSLRLGKAELADGILYTALVSDISERRNLLDRLTVLAERDSLTGLHNRHFLIEALDRVMEMVKRNGSGSYALIYMDLDNFKYVNDTLGHLAGDRLLQDVTQILLARARGTDLLSRLGGDEFAILLYDVDREQACAAAEAYRRQLADFVFRSERGLVNVGCSIGVAMVEADTRTKEDLLSRADVACHIAKRGGRNRVHLFEARDQEKVDTMSADMGWARRIKDNIEQDRFVMACQPIVSTVTGRISSYELLLRMPTEDGLELLMPSGFLPAADRFGLSIDIDHWVVRAGLREVRASALEQESSYSINLSAKSIGDKSLLKLIKKELESHELDARRVVFEVTETGAIANLHAAALFLQELREMGFSTALDDFGVGYSSFSYLKDLPVDYLKIDGSFVRGITTDNVKQAIVKSMNDVAHALGKLTVAEFVEDQATFDLL